MKISAEVEKCFLEPEFFVRADALWEQLERALMTEPESGSGLLRHVDSPHAYTFLLATADQIFTHDLTLAFLNRLRQWGKEKFGARHVSTPQIHIYLDGCRRELAPDAVPTQWHYLYSLTRNEAASVRLLEETGSKKVRFGLGLTRVANFRLGFNQFFVHETRQAYALDEPQRAGKPLEGAILLHGYLW